MKLQLVLLILIGFGISMTRANFLDELVDNKNYKALMSTLYKQWGKRSDMEVLNKFKYGDDLCYSDWPKLRDIFSSLANKKLGTSEWRVGKLDMNGFPTQIVSEFSVLELNNLLDDFANFVCAMATEVERRKMARFDPELTFERQNTFKAEDDCFSPTTFYCATFFTSLLTFLATLGVQLLCRRRRNRVNQRSAGIRTNCRSTNMPPPPQALVEAITSSKEPETQKHSPESTPAKSKPAVAQPRGSNQHRLFVTPSKFPNWTSPPPRFSRQELWTRSQSTGNISSDQVGNANETQAASNQTLYQGFLNLDRAFKEFAQINFGDPESKLDPKVVPKTEDPASNGGEESFNFNNTARLDSKPIGEMTLDEISSYLRATRMGLQSSKVRFQDEDQHQTMQQEESEWDARRKEYALAQSQSASFSHSSKSKYATSTPAHSTSDSGFRSKVHFSETIHDLESMN